MKKIISLVLIIVVALAFSVSAEYNESLIITHEIANADFNSDYPEGEEDTESIFGWNVTYTGTRIDLPDKDFSYADNATNPYVAFGIDKGAGNDGSDCLSIYAAMGAESKVYVYSDPIEASLGEEFSLSFEAIKHHQGVGSRRACTYIGLLFSDNEEFAVADVPSPQENPAFMALGGSFVNWASNTITTTATKKYVRVIAMLDGEGIGQANIDNISLTSKSSVSISNPTFKGPLGNTLKAMPKTGKIKIEAKVSIGSKEGIPVMMFAGIYDENGILRLSGTDDNFANPSESKTLTVNFVTKAEYQTGHARAYIFYFVKENGVLRLKSYMPPAQI